MQSILGGNIEKTRLSKKTLGFYGYWILVVTFFCTFLFSGCGFYAFSLFVGPLQADFGWGRGGIMLGFSIFVLATGVASPFAGRLVDHYGAGKVIAIGALIAGLGFILLSMTHNLWYLYGGYIIVGVGLAATGIVPATAIVSNWFQKRRGIAIGIMSTGIGAGGFAMAPFIGAYLIPNFGWRASYLVLALFTWILIPLVLLVLRTKPADMGLYPDGIKATEAVAEREALGSVSERLTLKMALATSVFWLIMVSYLLSGFSQAGVIQNQVPYLGDIGFPVATAAGVLGGVGLGSLMGKFFFGWLCDRIQAKYACCISLGLQLAAIIILMNTQRASPLAMIWLYAIVMGFGAGGWMPTLSMLVSTNFGLVSYGAIFGMLTLSQAIGAATGPLMAGYIYDTMNTYHWAFIIFVSLYIIAIPPILVLRRLKPPLSEKLCSFYDGNC